MRRLLTGTAVRLGATLVFAAPLAACIENSVGPNGVPTPSGEDVCESEAPSAVVVESLASCTPPRADWNLRVKWHWSDGKLIARRANVGRFADSDDDGRITVLDPIGILVSHSVGSVKDGTMYVLSGEGTVRSADRSLSGWGMYPTLGDADPSRLGVEVLMFGINAENSTIATAAAAPAGVLYLSPVEVTDDGGGARPFLTDLDADGAAEVLGRVATSAIDGRKLFDLNGSASGMVDAVAADLDLDGLLEVIAGMGSGPAVRDNEGNVRSLCPVYGRDVFPLENMMFAIGNLDDDDEREFAVVRPGVVAICEADGSVGASVSTDSAHASMVGVGELTGDARAELVMDEVVGAEPASIAAYDHDLQILWRYPLGAGNFMAAFALADLDGDGRHEIVVHGYGGELLILSPEGALLAQIDAPIHCSFDGPIVVDLDGDGLAEILAAAEEPNVAVYSNDAGGWPVRGAHDPWPGANHFPGDRNLDGTLPDPADVPWLIPGHNAWQGQAAGAELTDACSDDCETTRITAYVANYSVIDEPKPVRVELSTVDDGTILATAELDDLPSGVREAVQFVVATSAAAGGVRAVVVGSSAECLDVPNEAVLLDRPCR